METAALAALMAEHRLPPAFRDTVDRALTPLAARIAAEREGAAHPVVVGLCGSQGSGKSTFAEVLAVLLHARDLTTATLSLDDLYLTHEARAELAARRHPLLAVRGPPGTHDVALGIAVVGALTRPRTAAGRVALPRFDKASDTRAARQTWPEVTAPVDVVLFEGWCVGARPQAAAALEAPVNALEREEDRDGAWRRFANARLHDDYQALFARIDLLVLLQAPGFEQVLAWRRLQEEKLAQRLSAEGGGGRIMGADELARFVMHYERLTRWVLAEMPDRADVVVRLGADHEVLEVRGL